MWAAAGSATLAYFPGDPLFLFALLSFSRQRQKAGKEIGGGSKKKTDEPTDRQNEREREREMGKEGGGETNVEREDGWTDHRLTPARTHSYEKFLSPPDFVDGRAGRLEK